MDMKKWEECVAFHGHSCGGLIIGFQAAVYADQLLGLSEEKDEDAVCISENDACGVDAIQYLLHCSAGKGNLLFHLTGKMAFSFYNRRTEKSIRMILKEKPASVKKGHSLEYYMGLEPSEMFDLTEVHLALPERARHFASYRCEICGELTAENYIRLQEGKKVCIDCYSDYDRYHI